MMDSLHVLVLQGKVLYLGASDTPAWVVSAANEYATSRGKTPFSIYQGRWSIIDRDFERDIIPMARHYGMALAPWGILGGGKLQTKKVLEARKAAGESLRLHFGDAQSAREIEVSEALEKVAKQLGNDVSITAVALAYVMNKAGRVFPIVGGRKVEQLKDNIRSLDLSLTADQMALLESVVPFDVGFPGNFIGGDPVIWGRPHIDASGRISWESGPNPFRQA